MADAPGNDPLAIICGGGSFPGAVADAVARRGRRPVMFGIKGWADAAVIERYAHHWIAIGQAGRFFRLARAEHCREVLFIGTLLRPPITQLRLDWQTITIAAARRSRSFAAATTSFCPASPLSPRAAGLRVVGVKDVAPEIFVPEGVLGRHQPSERDQGRHRARA